MFRARSTSTLGTSSLLSWSIRSTRSWPRCDGVEGAGVHPPVLVHLEVGVGGLEQGVVLRGLDVPVPGVQDLPRGKGLEDGIGRGDGPPHAGTAVEEVHARRGHDALVEVRAAAVVSDVVEADVERGNPEHLGPCELGLGHPHAGLGGGDDQRPGVGESQSGGEVDREAEVGRLERGGLQVQAGRQGEVTRVRRDRSLRRRTQPAGIGKAGGRSRRL